jgi:Fungal specific transcription factor domain
MRYTEEMEIPFSTMGLDSLPRLPAIPDRDRCVSAYFSSIQPIFPILDVDDFSAIVGKYDWLSSDQNQEQAPFIAPADRPSLACVYAVMSIGVDEDHNANTPMGEVYLKTAFSLYAYIISTPYLSSVQALLLLSIALKVRNKDGSAWHVVGHAVRAAQSLGLHRSRNRDFVGNDSLKLDSQVWWTAYCLDKIMGFETGRPSAIDDEDCNQQVPSACHPLSKGDGSGNESLDCFQALINLAMIQSRIIKRLFKFKPKNNSAQILQEIGELDHSLISWLETVPPNIRPGNDMFCEPGMFSSAAFLALQYHQT